MKTPIALAALALVVAVPAAAQDGADAAAQMAARFDPAPEGWQVPVKIRSLAAVSAIERGPFRTSGT